MTSERIAVPAGTVEGQAMSAIDGIATATTGAGGVMHDMSVVGMFMNADFVVKGVILLLVLASIGCWKIIFEKYVRFRYVNRRMRLFEQSIWSGEPLEDRYEQLKTQADYPLARVFIAGMYEWLTATRKGRKAETKESPSNTGLTSRLGIKERVLQAMESTRNREMHSLEKNLGFLATVGSAAPFIGLFGTVWGIMRSFQSIAMTQNTTLAVVAPGIAEALFATGIGLFAAIPAVIFYNKYANQAADFSERLDSFIDEFDSVLSRELDK